MSRLLSQTMSGFPPHMLLGNLTMSNPALSTDPMTGSADLAWPPHLSPHPLLTPPPGGLPHIANNCIELARVQRWGSLPGKLAFQQLQPDSATAGFDSSQL